MKVGLLLHEDTKQYQLVTQWWEMERYFRKSLEYLFSQDSRAKMLLEFMNRGGQNL